MVAAIGPTELMLIALIVLIGLALPVGFIILVVVLVLKYTRRTSAEDTKDNSGR